MHLHIFHTFPNTLLSLAKTLQSDDKVLLINDAVYSLNQLTAHTLPCEILYLADDAKLRGLHNTQFTAISMDEFVQLTLQAQHCINW